MAATKTKTKMEEYCKGKSCVRVGLNLTVRSNASVEMWRLFGGVWKKQ